MADYPSVEYTTDSNVDRDDGRIVEKMDDNTSRARSMAVGVKRRWSLTHIVNSTDRDTLYSHHAAHLDSTFNFDDAETSSTHVAMYDGPPQTSYLSPSLYRINVRLIEV